MSHANAALTPRARLRLARLIVDQGWPIARAAERYDVSWPTAKRWAQRYQVMGPEGMGDRSSRPHRQPARTPAPVIRKIVHLRWKQRLGPVAIGDRLGMASSTVHAVLVRCRLNRLSHLDRVTGEPIRRYEHPYPGSLLHVDVKKLGNVPDGGETAATAVAVLRRAVAWFAARGVRIERVLSDNGSAYRSRLWREACAELAVTPKHTRPYRPQTNGKIERFHRTLADGWAFKRFYTSEHQRRAAMPAWIHEYNHHRPHTAIDKATPISRLTNLVGQYS